MASSAEPHLHLVRESTDKPVNEWSEGGKMLCMGHYKIGKHLINWEDGNKDREWPLMVVGENKMDRERWWWVVLMMSYSTHFSEEVQPWAPPDGHIFPAVSLVWPAHPSVERCGGYVWTCSLPACWGANICIWMGGKGRLLLVGDQMSESELKKKTCIQTNGAHLL